LFIGFTALILSKLKHTPFVFEIRDLWPESAIDSGIVTNDYIIRFSYWFEGFLYKRASLINVLTPAFKKHLIEKKHIPEEKIIFIPNAADFRLSDELLENFDAAEFKSLLGFADKFVVTYVGAHGVANHLIQLIEVAEQLKGTNLVIQLIGSGMQKEMLIREAEKKKLNNIKFVSSIPKKEVFKFILASDMGISALKKTDTYKTIYSNKTFDYMACKKPVLLLIDGISRELVEEADCGIYAEPEKISDIVSKLKIAMNDWTDKTRRRKGENGYHYAKQHFDREVLSKKYLTLINVQK
jgi:glycosyltransferase involved in cell wall biosynthesis